MLVALSLCSVLALIIAAFSGDAVVWTISISANLCIAVLGIRHRKLINASLISGLLFVLCGFSALHVSLLAMSDATLNENLPVLISAFSLIFVATLVVCIAMVERASQQQEPAEMATEFDR